MSSKTRPALTLDSLRAHFPKYDLLSVLDEGGERILVRARQESLEREVDLRVERIRPESTAEPGKGAERVRAIGKLNHANVRALYDYGVVEDLRYAVLEPVAGKSLAEEAHEALSAEEAVSMVEALGVGLQHAHKGGLTHENLDPGKICRDERGVLKICFGIEGGGSPSEGYAAPEVLNGAAADERSDVYSLGCLLFRFLTGQDPEKGPLPSPAMISGCSLVLDGVVRRATDERPEKRYQSVTELLGGLKQSAAMPAPAVGQAARPVLPGSALTRDKEKRSTGEFPVKAVVQLICVAVVAYLALKIGFAKDENQPPATGKPIASDDSSRPRRSLAERSGADSNPDRPKRPVGEPAQIGGTLPSLKTQLFHGERTVFPTGTIEGNKSFYFLVEERRTWADARTYAEEYGAQLAVFPTEEQRRWIRRQLHSQSVVWLGGGTREKLQWQWIDGTTWVGKRSLRSVGEEDLRVVMTAKGNLYGEEALKDFAFILQWHKDGSNPGSRAEELRRANFEEEGVRSLPLECRSVGGRQFLYLERILSWTDARKLADSVGAQLAVPSSEEEHRWICRTFRRVLRTNQAVWLGGYRLKGTDRWQWVSREPWNNVGWKDVPDASGEASSLLLRGGQSAERMRWDLSHGEKGEATGVLLEWGQEAGSDPGESDVELDPWLAGVNLKMAKLVAKDLKEFQGHRRAFVRNYTKEMRKLIQKELGIALQASDGPLRDDLRAGLKALDENVVKADREDRTLRSIPTDLPYTLVKLDERLLEEFSKTTEDKFDQKLKAHMQYYQAGVLKKADSLKEEGFLTLADELEELVAPLDHDLQVFLNLLFPTDSIYAVLPWEARKPPRSSKSKRTS